MECDFVFADGEMNLHTLEMSDARAALDFAFRAVPELRRDGWDVVETSKWPYRLSEEPAELMVTTRAEAGEAFKGNDWFSLGFQAEIGGKAVDVAPLVAAFLEQIREDWDEVPDVETLTQRLAERPVYLDRGKAGHVALDLSPLAPLLHLFLSHHAELGALHPSDADAARLAEEALAGSGIRFADKAGILPLARSLRALAEARDFAPPAGLTAQLRDYQAFGAAWMGSLLEAGFGGVLADDMGLGKTVQTLALLQARREAGAPGPALLIVPTSLLHGWQTQAAQFTPDLRLVILHGTDRAALRDAASQADLVVTTYPLLARDRDWLAAQDWQLVILDEAQTLKNPASQMAKTLREIPAHGRLALTGTPLENSLQDIWTLIDWVNPGLLGDRKRFQTLFRTPIEKHGDADRTGPAEPPPAPVPLAPHQGGSRRRTAAEDRNPRTRGSAETATGAVRDGAQRDGCPGARGHCQTGGGCGADHGAGCAAQAAAGLLRPCAGQDRGRPLRHRQRQARPAARTCSPSWSPKAAACWSSRNSSKCCA